MSSHIGSFNHARQEIKEIQIPLTKLPNSIDHCPIRQILKSENLLAQLEG